MEATAALQATSPAWDTETRVIQSEDGRGHATLASRDLASGEVLFREPPLAIVASAHDPPWLAQLRQELKVLSEACAWQYCVAVHCLSAQQLPQPAPLGLVPLPEEKQVKLQDLCGMESGDEDCVGPSELAAKTAEYLLQAAEMRSADGSLDEAWLCTASSASRSAASGSQNISNSGRGKRDCAAEWLANRLDDVAVRISRNGFQTMDMKSRPPLAADALFHRISFFNHCCASQNNASWTWNGPEGLLTVRTTREVAAGEELTISYIAKPWCDLARPARRRYLKQNFNFVCLCKACCQPAETRCTVSASNDAAEGDKGSIQTTNGKLAGMLLRWMRDGQDEIEEEEETASGAAEPQPNNVCPAIATKPESAGPRVPLTEEGRIDRVLERCAGEGLIASREDAGLALKAEESHVGKALIRLRRERRQLEAAVAKDSTTDTAEDGKAHSRAVEPNPVAA
mmetsp:Transcript_89127/g.171532  ORF Transcript_89127/g.171532 Transcript_89127/m.171532 type:complete len:457 (-) Transcript_89127:82-1452(-)